VESKITTWGRLLLLLLVLVVSLEESVDVVVSNRDGRVATTNRAANEIKVQVLPTGPSMDTTGKLQVLVGPVVVLVLVVLVVLLLLLLLLLAACFQAASTGAMPLVPDRIKAHAAEEGS
jgi:hypothetical protein